jgi:hypothetical protein
MLRGSRIVALVSLLAAAPAVAHESADRAIGIVASITAERIVVTASDGHAVTFALTPETRFFRGDKPARSGDVRVGQRAVVHGKRSGEAVQALRVKLGPSK